MSLNISNGSNYNCGFHSNYNSGTDSGWNLNYRGQVSAQNILNPQTCRMAACEINPEQFGDYCQPDHSYAPQDSYTPRESSSDQIYSPRDFKPAPGVQTPAKPVVKPASKKQTGAKLKPLKQSNFESCGQTSVAMSVNYLTGKKLTDSDVNAKHGFALLSALNTESKGSGYKWHDNGNFSKKSWPAMERRLNQEKTPVLIGLNGQFSASGNGHIVTLMSIDGNKVTYADPADGKIKTTTKQAIENAPGHPDGKFMYVASKG